MNGKIYSVVSYREMMETRERTNRALQENNRKYKNFLITCLCEAGFENSKKVRIKTTGAVGVLEVEDKQYLYGGFPRPYEIKFYPETKSGEISKKSRYIPLSQYREEDLVKQLTNLFELVGDENAS